MKNFLKSCWKTLVFFAVAGILGGFFVGLFLMDSYPAEIVEQITAQGFTPFLLGLVMYIRGKRKLKNSDERKAYDAAKAAYKASKKKK